MADLIAKFDAGVSVNGGDRPATEDECGVLKISAVTEGMFRPEENKVVDGLERDRANLNPKRGRLIMSRANTPQLVGASAYIHTDHPNLFLSDKLWQFEPREEVEFSMRWLGFLLSSPAYRKRMGEVATGSSQSMKNISQESVLQMLLPVPPFAEQRRIAQLLGDWESAIEKTERLIAAKEDRFLALIDRLVLKPASGKVWKTQKLRDIATRVQRRSDGGGHPVLTISNASGFVLQEEKYKRYMAGESVKDYILLRRGEFAYNKGNSLRFQFGCVYQLHTYDDAIVPHVYVCFRLHDDISSSYLRHLFAVDYLKPQLGKLVKTGIRNNGLLNIRPNEFLGVTVPIPPLEKQHRIAEILDAARSEIDLLKRQADAYRTQKRGLMQKLLTGQWRVNVPEEANK